MGDSFPIGGTTGGPIKIVDQIVGAMGQFNIAIPVAFQLVRSIISALRDANVENLPTDAEVIAALKAKASAAKQADDQWLREHGYL